jgi:transglutaminase-like putative cysteine protease
MSRPAVVLPYRSQVLTRLLLVLVIVIAPLLLRLPPWLIAVSASFGAWCYFITDHRLKPPAPWLRSLLAVLLLAAVHAHYGTLLGREAGAALLIAMLSLKLMEVKEVRDIYIVVFLGYFLIIIGFLFTQSPGMAAYMLVAVMLLTAVLNDLNRSQFTTPAANLRLAGALLLRALPLALLLFVLFPRISGPLWGLPKDAYSGMSGLDDEMTPGEISQLSQSDNIAFRASFDGPIPPPSQRYWRGPVLWETDGKGWRSGGLREESSGRDAPPFIKSGTAVDYTVTLEPHNRRWLYALDLVDSAPPSAKITSDFLMLNAAPVRERLRYSVSSYPEGIASQLSRFERQRALQLPAYGDPRARALARSWRFRYRDDAAIVQQALAMFRAEPFVYTLHPPLIGENFVDTFLFETRKGFCEHYAASFSFLMRAAGIPARVVTGYQGGEFNPLGNYLIVRQRDAHAWAEVWLDGRGWTRVDPTAAVAPERVEHSIDNGFQAQGEAVRFDLTQAAWLGALWREAGYGLDALNNKWNQWVLSYGPERQEELLGWLRLGKLHWQTVAALLLVAAGGIVMWIVLHLFKWERRGKDLAALAYHGFCRKLARRGLPRLAYEAPGTFAARISKRRPDLAAQTQTITTLYVALRYSPHQPPLALAHLQRAVRRFQP